jgi:hypothetical protein
MKKYELSQINKLPGYFKFNAGTKARIDVDEIYRMNGFTVVYMPDIQKDKFLFWHLRRVLLALKIFFIIEPYSQVHIQHPAQGVIRQIIRLLKFKHIKTTLFIHDLDYFRYNNKHRKQKEIKLFKMVDELIVPTPSMVEEIRKNNVKTPCKIMYLFDYLCNDQACLQEKDYRTIVFAGNMKKSPFLKKLTSDTTWDLKAYLYGATDDTFPENSVFSYQGCFDPNDISNIKGAWGLVWDGDSIKTCQSNMGIYLRINASHKVSLYLASGKPIIVWDQSSLKDFVESHQIGISVSSLLDVPEKLNAISEATYEKFVENAQKIACKMKQGAFLSTCLSTNES